MSGDMKEFICTSCEKPVMATKFASQKKIQCEECKAKKLPVNQDIVNKILSSSDKAVTKPKESVVIGDKKPAKCTVCDADIMIGKFASPKTAVCENCGGSKSTSKIKLDTSDIKIDISKINRATLPNIDDMYVAPMMISNQKLRNVDCPACGSKMNIVRLVDSSPDRGLIISYQCKNDKCMFIMTGSEQTKFKLSPVKSHEVFNYRGELIKDLTSSIVDTRIKNSFEYMYKLLVDNKVQIDGQYIPEFVTVGDYKKDLIGIRNDEISNIIKWVREVQTSTITHVEFINELAYKLNKIRGIFEEEE